MTDTVNAGGKPIWMGFRFFMKRLNPIAASFNEDSGFSRRFSLFGVCNDEADGKGRFKYRKVRATFFAPKDPNSLNFMHFHDERLFKKHGVEGACGQMKIREGVSDDEYGPPFQVVIAVDHETLDRLWEAANGTISDCRLLRFWLGLCSSTFPDYSHVRVNGGICDDLDISEDRIYPLKSFSLEPTNHRFIESAEARPRIPPSASKGGAAFFLKVGNIKIEVHDNLYYYKITINESDNSLNLKRRWNQPEMKVEIFEYDIDSETGEYPEVSGCGSFRFCPKRKMFEGDTGDLAYLFITLLFTRHDFDKFVPILLYTNDIVLELSLDICKADLEAANDEIRGNVEYFSFVLGSTKVAPT